MMKTVIAAGFAALLPTTFLPRPASAPAAFGPRMVTVTAQDYSFDAPSSVPAGTIRLRLVNNGKELHHIQLVKLEQGKTLADLNKAMESHGPPPAWFVEVGGPNAPALGSTSEAIMTLDAGNYVLMCFIPSPDGAPHMMKGMVKTLTVTPSKEIPLEPKADVVVKLVDYGFDISAPIVAGRQIIKIENTAEQPHEVFIVKLNAGKTPMDIAKWAEKLEGPPPGTPAGGATGLRKGRSMYIAANLEPGRYGLICFVPDAKDGKPHHAHGMMREITVEAKVAAR
ncbi:MAG: hypothetical protein ACJ78Y_23365 [Myxococcales bacterium]